MQTLEIAVLAGLLLTSGAAWANEASRSMVMYKDPLCDCCEGHAAHLRQNGFDVQIVPTPDLDAVKQANHVPAELAGCHTVLVDGYVVEGHVPASVVDRLLTERPAVRGISLPGMPAGSPGMSGSKTEPFQIYSFSDRGDLEMYAVD